MTHLALALIVLKMSSWGPKPLPMQTFVVQNRDSRPAQLCIVDVAKGRFYQCQRGRTPRGMYHRFEIPARPPYHACAFARNAAGGSGFSNCEVKIDE